MSRYPDARAGFPKPRPTPNWTGAREATAEQVDFLRKMHSTSQPLTQFVRELTHEHFKRLGGARLDATLDSMETLMIEGTQYVKERIKADREAKAQNTGEAARATDSKDNAGEGARATKEHFSAPMMIRMAAEIRKITVERNRLWQLAAAEVDAEMTSLRDAGHRALTSQERPDFPQPEDDDVAALMRELTPDSHAPPQ